MLRLVFTEISRCLARDSGFFLAGNFKIIY